MQMNKKNPVFFQINASTPIPTFPMKNPVFSAYPIPNEK